MAVLFLLLLFLCGLPQAATGKGQEVGDISAICKIGEGLLIILLRALEKASDSRIQTYPFDLSLPLTTGEDPEEMRVQVMYSFL